LRRKTSRLRQGGPGSRAGGSAKLHTMKEQTLDPGIIQVTKDYKQKSKMTQLTGRTVYTERLESCSRIRCDELVNGLELYSSG